MIGHKTRQHQAKLRVEKRAAQIRLNWSHTERVKRLGLPPDLPQRLQAYLTGQPDRNW